MRYDETAKTLYAVKCSTATSDIDPDCQGLPYEIFHDIVFEVAAVGDPDSVNRQLEVRIEIGNSCVTDYVVMNTLMTNTNIEIKDNDFVDYVLRQPATPLIIMP